jgi:chromosome partitioning protein
LDQLFQIVEQVKEINENLRLAAIVLTMYDVRNSLTISVEGAARNRFGDLVMKATIPVNVRIAEAPLDGVSVGEYEMNSAGAQAYRALAKEIMSRG